MMEIDNPVCAASDMNIELMIWDHWYKYPENNMADPGGKSHAAIAAILSEYDAISFTVGVDRISMVLPVLVHYHGEPTHQTNVLHAMIREIRERIAALPKWNPPQDDPIWKNDRRFSLGNPEYVPPPNQSLVGSR